MPEPIVYWAYERPDVEVMWEGAGARVSYGCSARTGPASGCVRFSTDAREG